MSKVFFQVRKGVSLDGQSGPPSDPANGDIYYDSTLNNFVFYVNGQWVDFAGSGSIPNVISASTYSVLTSDNGKLIAMTNSGARTVSLPTAPNNSFTVIIKDAAGTSQTSNITINAGGSDVIDGSSSFTINSEYESVELVYATATATWYVI